MTLPGPLVVPTSGNWIGNDGSWSTFFVQVGTPPQPFQVLPSISGQAIYIPLDDACAPEQITITDCGGKRGVGIFESRQSLGYQRNKSSTWQEVGVYRMGLGANLGLIGVAHYGFDIVSLGLGDNATQVEDSVVAVYAAPDPWVGQIGLSPSLVFINEEHQSSSLLQRLKDERIIPSLSFGYQAGSSDRFTRVAGSLTLGGYDRSRQSNETLLVPLNPDVVVSVQSLSITSTNGTTTRVLSDGIKATIDSNTPDIWLPTSVCDELASALGLTYFEEADRYIVTEPARSGLKSSLPVFSFILGISATGGSTISIDIPYGAFDLQATFPIFSAPAYFFPIRRAANESQFTLGRAFLQEVYLSVDWERNVFNISQALFNSPPLVQDIVTIEPVDRLEELNPQANDPGGSTVSLSTGAIAGIAIGSLILIVLVALGLWVYLRKHKRRKIARIEPDTQVDASTDDKEVSATGQGPSTKQNIGVRAHFELEGQPVKEMYAPPEFHEHVEYKHAGRFTELVEADSMTRMHELPATIPELPAPEDYTRRKT
ncbi:eukaryotic aspartyl protease [Stagonosporopsis vannaccii]|nr:eukaryotic aspartyl protease [Stagonosporopsis vannaccii]